MQPSTRSKRQNNNCWNENLGGLTAPFFKLKIMKTISQQIAEIERNAKNVLCPEILCAMNQKYNELKSQQNEQK